MATLDFLSGQVLRSTAGAIYTGAKASYWSDAGATTPLATYSDAGLSSANTNPVVADGTTGAFGPIYLQARRYWRTVTTSAGVSLPQFNLGPIDAGMTLVTSAAAPSPTYPLLWWYDTTSGNLKRRNAADSAWLDFGGIDSLLNAATVTEQLAGTVTAKSSTPDSVAALWQRGSDIASAATLSLPATGGGVFNITGTTGISGISSASGGRQLWLRFAGALTLTHNGTSFILPGAANITTVAGDIALFINEAATDATGSNWRCFGYQRSSGSPINLTDHLGAQSDLETATSLTLLSSIGRMQYHPGVAKCRVMYDQSSGTATAAGVSYNLSSLTDGAAGIATPNFTTAMSSANYHPSGVCQRPNTNNDAVFSIQHAGVSSPAASNCPLATTVAAVATDMTYVSFVAHGDQ